MTELPRFLTYKGIPVWRHIQVINWVSQVTSGILVVTLVIWFFTNIGNAIQDREIPYGFSFLSRAYQTPIGQHFIPYESSDTFLYAFGVAATNTLIVSIVGVILATALGIFVGAARLSGNWIVSKLALVYIEFFRNVPLLLQLFFWFYIVLALPPVRQGYVVAERLYINNAGFSLPFPARQRHPRSLDLDSACGRGSSGRPVGPPPAFATRNADRGDFIPTGVGSGNHGRSRRHRLDCRWRCIRRVPPVRLSTGPAKGLSAASAAGLTLSGGLIALLAGLVIYTSSFIAEIVRAGLQSVNRGQSEAARALGLSQMDTLRQVTFPQALRVIVPPLISQCLNLTKNSSLAAAIGYSDLTSVAKTMTQTAPGSVHIHSDYGGLPWR